MFYHFIKVSICKYCHLVLVFSSVSDHWFQCGSGSSCLRLANLDPGSQTNADSCGSGSCQTMPSQKVGFWHDKYTLSVEFVTSWYGSGSARKLPTNGSGSCCFRQWPLRRQLKMIFFVLYKATFTSFFRIQICACPLIAVPSQLFPPPPLLIFQCAASQAPGFWIHIDFGRLDLDPWGQKWPIKIGKSEEISHVSKCWMISL